MTMTELIRSLERAGWRFGLDDDGHVHARPPKPRPTDVAEVLAELKRRKTEAVGFLRARDEAVGTMLTFGLPTLPVFDAPPPAARVVPFPAASEPAPLAAGSSGRG